MTLSHANKIAPGDAVTRVKCYAAADGLDEDLARPLCARVAFAENTAGAYDR